MHQATQHWAHTRKHALDWLRVLAFALLIIYHVGMAYVADWGWHVKSSYESTFLQNLMLWSNQWRMCLLFIISGAAISFQLHRNASWRFATGTTGRLLPPLVFGALVIVAPQVYIELKTKGLLEGTHFAYFWLDYAGSAVGLGNPLPQAYIRGAYTNVTWNHLWYLPYLFTYCLAMWAIYPLISNKYTAKLAAAFNKLPRWGIAISLYAAPISIFYFIGEALWQAYPTTFDLVNDWYNNARYFTAFVFGVFAVRSLTLWQTIHTMRTLSLTTALLTYAAILFYIHGGELGNHLPLLTHYEDTIRSAVWTANSWLWLMAVIGYAQHFLNTSNTFIQKANKGVFCFYIVHQTIIVLAVYWLSNYKLGPWLEPVVVAVITLMGCLACYRATNKYVTSVWVRRLLGLTRKDTPN